MESVLQFQDSGTVLQKLRIANGWMTLFVLLQSGMLWTARVGQRKSCHKKQWVPLSNCSLPKVEDSTDLTLCDYDGVTSETRQAGNDTRAQVLDGKLVC